MRRPEKRPEALALSVRRLLDWVQEGAIRIPEFQRAMRWTAKDVRELFDSIYKGYPVGGLLFVKREDRARTVAFGARTVDAPARTDALFVVDGQQRIHSLAATLLHPDPVPRGGIFAVWFDLEEERFLTSQRATPEPTWIPLNVVGDSVALHRWAGEWPLGRERKDLVERAFELGAIVREHELSGYVLRDSDPTALRVVFLRVNESGARMLESEVFDALYESDGKPIESACFALEADTGFGPIAPDEFLRATRFVADELRSTATTLAPEDRERWRGNVAETREAMRRAVELLMDDARILHRALLPYALPLLVLTSFFRHFPNPSPRTRTLLVRWIWRGVLSESHGDNGDATLRGLDRREGENEATWTERLLATVPDAPPIPSAKMPWGAGALVKASVLAIAALGAREPPSGPPRSPEEITETLGRALGKGPVGEVFVDVSRSNHDSVACAVWLAKARRKELQTASPDVLASHGIDVEAAAALRAGDIETFKRRRIDLLDEHFRRFFLVLAGIGEDDRPAVAELSRRVRAAVTLP